MIDQDKFKTPILFIIFNRIETTKLVFESIKKIRPEKLYLAADGPRNNNLEEIKKTNEVRNYVISNIDWECQIYKFFNDKNLGCKYGVSGAISWFFENEEKGIILEDDCLPSKSFFWFCDYLLKKYQNENQIMHIAGMTYVEKKNNQENYSYHFCKVGGIWGWATWKRAWKKYEIEMDSYPQAIKENVFEDLFIGENKLKTYYQNLFKKNYENRFSWDYQWTFTKIINNSINIMPSKNLVKNIGYGAYGATHTKDNDYKISKMKLNELNFPLKDPKFLVIDSKFNLTNFEYSTQKKNIDIIKNLLKIVLPKSIINYLKKI